MSQKMVIDATRPGEARVVVLNGERVEEFDYETATKTQVKGNIYLAKVTRVEPSLQAAFVEYGGNRHGFLPFSEIHPDYYRLPVADREQLLAEEQGSASQHGEHDDGSEGSEGPESAMDRALDQEVPEEPASSNGDDPAKGGNGRQNGSGNGSATNGDDNGNDVEEIASEHSIDTLGGDEEDEVARRRAHFLRKYKIQEVIKRRQVMLVQVTKEERGTKGAAITTYLSLAGRYCVLMPNTAKGGGISRKISNAADRKRLKAVVSELSIPEGMAVIVRTAGSQRTKTEIRRDYEYLLRLWDEIRNKTLESTAPSLIHEEANLIKRAIRDIYSRDMERIEVEGEEGYKTARAVMRMLMPSHARKVIQYKDQAIPLFQKYRVEEQLEAMHAHTVQLRSGGSIVLNPTEALVAIDVNSGKATSERHIEETAYKTNLEAADEVARQLRLRDLAGLIVIDFIDMEDPRHIREVERRLKEAMKLDRARIQLGRISPFGLLELSRQRLRPSLFETVTVVCPTCRGLGHLRSPDSLSLTLLNQVTDEAVRRGPGRLEVHAPTNLALYLLNEKRSNLRDIEERFGIELFVRGDDSLGAQEFVLRRLTSEGKVEERRIDAQKTPASQVEEKREESGEEEEKRSSGRNRRRNGRSRNGRSSSQGNGHTDQRSHQPAQAQAEEVVEAEEQEAVAESAAPQPGAGEGDDERSSKRRRRGRRGGRRRRGRRDGSEATTSQEGQQAGEAVGQEEDSSESELQADGSLPEGTDAAGETVDETGADASVEMQAAELAASTGDDTMSEPVGEEAAPQADEDTAAVPAEATAESKPRSRRSRRGGSRKTTSASEEVSETAPASEEPAAEKASGEIQEGAKEPEAEPSKPKRRAPRRRSPARTPAAATEGEAAEGETTEAEPLEPQREEQPAAPAASDEPAVDTAPPEAQTADAGHQEPEEVVVADSVKAPEPQAESEPEQDAEREPEVVADQPVRPARRGWWSRG